MMHIQFKIRMINNIKNKVPIVPDNWSTWNHDLQTRKVASADFTSKVVVTSIQKSALLGTPKILRRILKFPVPRLRMIMVTHRGKSFFIKNNIPVVLSHWFPKSFSKHNVFLILGRMAQMIGLSLRSIDSRIPLTAGLNLFTLLSPSGNFSAPTSSHRVSLSRN